MSGVENLMKRPRLTCGRHCTCSACAQTDWTRPDLAPCGMHGEGCPAAYQPITRNAYEREIIEYLQGLDDFALADAVIEVDAHRGLLCFVIASRLGALRADIEWHRETEGDKG